MWVRPQPPAARPPPHPPPPPQYRPGHNSEISCTTQEVEEFSVFHQCETRLTTHLQLEPVCRLLGLLAGEGEGVELHVGQQKQPGLVAGDGGGHQAALGSAHMQQRLYFPE